MNRRCFYVDLLSDVVVTMRSATEGGHTCLDHIPGAVFLGVAANRLYDQLSEDESFLCFHSGKVRFSPAYPDIEQGLETFPVPLCFHREKLAVHGDKDVLHNMLLKKHGKAMQLKQQRDGYVSSRGTVIDPPRKRFKLKVSVASSLLSVRDKSELFGYESLPRGTRYKFSIEADDDVSDGLVERIARVLQNGSVYIGRSKHAEYGMATIFPCDDFSQLEVVEDGTGEIHILALSDIALFDLYGQPTLTPCPRHFYLPDTAVVNYEKSYLRKRRYSPFNSKRCRHDLERHVIQKGSVITFSGVAVQDSASLADQLARGVGSYRFDGLGRVALNPAVLYQKELRKQTTAAGSTAGNAVLPPSNDELSAWLVEQEKTAAAAEDAFFLSREWIANLSRFVHTTCPGTTQWGLVRQLAAVSENLDDFKKRLFDRENGLLNKGVSARAWASVIKGTSVKETLWQCVTKACGENVGANVDSVVLSALRQTAAGMASRIQAANKGRER